MSEAAKKAIWEWVRDMLSVLGVIGVVIGVYVNVVSRVTATEQRVIYLEEGLKSYGDMPAALARIEEQIKGTRKDVQRIEENLAKRR